MSSTQVQRTLVKSPPELWAELSDPASLARHLGELGEIRITRVDPEQTVEWSAEDASGTVLIRPSAWGTRVTLTVSRGDATPAPETPAPETPAAEAPHLAQPEAIDAARAGAPETDALAPQLAEPGAPEPPAEEPQAREPESAVSAPPRAEPEAPEPAVAEALATVDTKAPDPAEQAVQDPDPAEQPVQDPEREGRRGFLARILGFRSRRRRDEPTATDWTGWPIASDTGASVSEDRDLGDVEAGDAGEAVAIEEPAAPDGAPAAPPPIAPEQPAALEPPAPVSAAVAAQKAAPAASALQAAPVPQREPDPPRDAADERVEAVLSSVLDRLGSAHHRPFSRG